MTTIQHCIKGEALQNYARLLLSEGFQIRIPQPRRRADGEFAPVSWFIYSREGNFGSVELDARGYSHLMPISPSRYNGAAILIGGQRTELLLEDAVQTVQDENVGLYNEGQTFRNHATASRYGSYTNLTE